MGHLQEVGIEQKDSQAYPICQAVQGLPAAPYGRALGFHPTLNWCHSQGRGGGVPSIPPQTQLHSSQESWAAQSPAYLYFHTPWVSSLSAGWS